MVHRPRNGSDSAESTSRVPLTPADPAIAASASRADHALVMTEQAPFPTPVSPPQPTEQDGPMRAYVLEDDVDIAALEADVLRDLGFTVVTCTRIVELGDLMELALPHLLVVDVMLPDGDGGDITELLRSAWPGIPVVIVSAASRERLAELAPIGPVVPKPFDIDEFARAVLGAVEEPLTARQAS
jgi:CheY-like chemotaxis protein